MTGKGIVRLQNYCYNTIISVEPKFFRFRGSGKFFRCPQHYCAQGGNVVKTVKSVKKKGTRTAAAVGIGSKLLRMRIAQLRKGEVSELESLEYPISIGHEVFSNTKISFESIRSISSALRGFSALMQEYGVDSCRVVATTALREAVNRAFVVDQLKIQNGVQVEILEDNQEKAFVYGEILKQLPEHLKDGNTLIAYIGTGSIGVAVIRDETAVFSKNIPVGALKLHDMLGSLQASSIHFHEVLEEYIHVAVGRFLSVYPGGFPSVSQLVLADNGSALIASLCKAEKKGGVYTIQADSVRELYATIRNMTPEKISFSYQISESDAELLYTTLSIYLYLINLTGVKSIYAPQVDLLRPILQEILLPKTRELAFDRVRRSTLACVRELGKSFQCNMEHAERIAELSGLLFDRMKEIHGLDSRNRLLLEVASLLHECGYYTHPRQYSNSTFHVIRSMDIYGIAEKELYLVASTFLPADSPEAADSLSVRQQLIVSKLAAIFRLADSLDQSQKQKLKNLKARLDKNRLLITAESMESASLEEWAFSQAVPFFEDVFGVHPELTVRDAPVKTAKQRKV